MFGVVSTLKSEMPRDAASKRFFPTTLQLLRFPALAPSTTRRLRANGRINTTPSHPCQIWLFERTKPPTHRRRRQRDTLNEIQKRYRRLVSMPSASAEFFKANLLRRYYSRISCFVKLNFAPTFERARQRHLVGVLQIAADRQPARESGQPNSERLDQPLQVHRCRLAFQVRIRGEHNLFDL